MGLLWQLWGELLGQRLLGAAEPGPPRDIRRAQAVKNVLRRIRSSYGQPLTLEDLAAEAALEPKYFCRVFRQITGRTPINYLNYYRVECAAELLCTTQGSITDIALECGFGGRELFQPDVPPLQGPDPRPIPPGPPARAERGRERWSAQASSGSCGTGRWTWSAGALAPPSTWTTPHYHDCFEVYFQISGDRNLLSGGRFHHLEPGSVLWIPKFDLHQSFQGQQDTGTRAVLYFRESTCGGCFKSGPGSCCSVRRALSGDAPGRFPAAQGPGAALRAGAGQPRRPGAVRPVCLRQLVLLLEAWSRAGGALPQEAAPHHGPQVR